MVFLAHRFNSQSIICFAEASRLDPTNPRWPYFIGHHYLLEGCRPSIPYLQKAYALAQEPAYKSASRMRLAEAYIDSCEPIEAEKLLEEEVTVNPQNPRARHGQAVLAIGRGDYRAAITYLNLVPNASAHHQIAAALAACHRHLGEIAEAELYERKSASIVEEPWPDPYVDEFTNRQTGFVRRLRLAIHLQKQKRTREAAEIIEELVRENPGDQTLFLLGFNLMQLGRHRQAEQIFRMVLTKNPNHSPAHDYLGLSLSMQAEEKVKAGDKEKSIHLFEAAVIEFREAAKLNPKEGVARFRAGLALKNLGRLPEAADEYRAALLATPEHAFIHQEMGEVLLEMNKPAEAIPFLKEAIRLASPNDRGQKLLEKAKSRLP
jgi:tetratricopeptide (TPR) repeat protein